jgi:hypothetical protein
MEDFSTDAPLSVSALAARMVVPFSASVASRRNSGKSTFVRELATELEEQGKIAAVCVFSPSLKTAQGDFGSVISANILWEEANLAQYIEKRKARMAMVDEIKRTKQSEDRHGGKRATAKSTSEPQPEAAD